MAIEGIPKEMTAVQVVEFNKPYVVHQVPTPSSLKLYEILLKVAVASLCHTDSMVMAGKFPTKLPCTASHEGTGTVAAVGSDVKNFKLGDRAMAGLPKSPCGHIGVFLDGAFAEYLVVDSRVSAHVPDSMSFKSASPLACAGCTIYRAIIVSEVSKGGWLAIVGSGGGLGHLGLQMARAKGINVIGIDARDEGIELSKKVGCDHVFDARKGKEAVVKEVQALTEGLGVQAAINTSEHDTAAPLSCAITRMHGRMVQVAQPDMVCVPFLELIFRDIRVVGTLISGQEQARDMLNLVAEHKIHVETNVFHGLKEVPKMVELSHSGKMKGKAVCVVDEKAIEVEQGKVTS